MAEVAQRRESVQGTPVVVLRVKLLADALAVMNKYGADDSPSQHGTSEQRNGCVHADQDTATNEGGRPFPVPTPRFDVQSPTRALAPDVDPGERVPVIEDTDSIIRGNALYESGAECEGEGLELADGLASARGTGVHRSDGQSHGGRGGEEQLQFTGNANNEELAERRDEEQTEERTHQSDGDQGAKILLRCALDGVESVDGGNTGDKDTGDTTGSRGRGLDNGVLLGTEVAAQDRPVVTVF